MSGLALEEPFTPEAGGGLLKLPHLSSIIENMQDMLNCQISMLFIMKDDDMLVPAAWSGISDANALVFNCRKGQCLVGLTAEQKEIILSSDLPRDPRTRYPQVMKAERMRSAALAPVGTKNQVVGVLCAVWRTPREFPQQTNLILLNLAKIAAASISLISDYHRNLIILQHIAKIMPQIISEASYQAEKHILKLLMDCIDNNLEHLFSKVDPPDIVFSNTYGIILITIDDSRIIDLNLLTSVVEHQVPPGSLCCYKRGNEELLMVVCPVQEGRSAYLKAIAFNIRKELSEVLRQRINIALSPLVKNANNFFKAYRIARQSLPISRNPDVERKGAESEAMVHPENLRVEQIISQPWVKESMNTLTRRYLHPILDYDKKHGTQLAKTLRTYLANNGNILKTSRELYVHFNTLRYRLQRIEEIAHISLSDQEDRLSLQLALKNFEIN